MMQSKQKEVKVKNQTINIDKINGIENENETDGYVITDEEMERFGNGLSESLKTLKNAGINLTELTKGLSGANLGLLKNVASIGGTSIGITKALEGITSPTQGIGTRLSSLLAESGLSKALTTLQSVITPLSLITPLNIGLDTWFTPEIQEAMRLFGERMREKQAIEVDRYNNKTHLGMSKIYGFDYLLLTKKQKSDFFTFVIHSFDREDERWELSVLGFIESITDREWQDWGMKYYALQKNKSFDSLIEFEKQLSTPPALKENEQGKVNIIKPYKSEADITEELDKFKKAVTDICTEINGLPSNQFPSIAKIKSDALSKSGLTERVVNSNIKKSTTLIKTGLKTETTTGHIRQIVGQFFKGNNLILRKLKLNA